MVENYQAYLLRLKRPQSSGRWQATLQNVQTGETRHFATEEEMVRYLLQTLAGLPHKVQSTARGDERFTTLGTNEK